MTKNNDLGSKNRGFDYTGDASNLKYGRIRRQLEKKCCRVFQTTMKARWKNVENAKMKCCDFTVGMMNR